MEFSVTFLVPVEFEGHVDDEGNIVVESVIVDDQASFTLPAGGGDDNLTADQIAELETAECPQWEIGR